MPMTEDALLFHRIVAGCGLLVMVAFAWLLSSHKRLFPWRIVAGGLIMQLVLVFAVLKTDTGLEIFQSLGDGFNRMLGFVDEGCSLVFGDNFRDFYLAFRVLPTIIFFSSLMAIL